MKSKRTFFEKLANRYQLVVRNEEDLAEKSTFVFSYAKLLITLFVIFAMFLALAFFLAKTILAEWFDPKYAQIKLDKNVHKIAAQLDSLTVEANRRNNFIKNLKHIFGDDTLKDRMALEDTLGIQGKPVATIGNMELTSLDSQFREEFEQSEVSMSGFSGDKYHRLQEIFFFSPVTGFVSNHYNPRKGFYGIKIITQANEPVKAVADGTVILATWTREFGYVIAIQHAENLVSIYKHSADILKKNGTFVAAGSIISVIGDDGGEVDLPHLSFELWCDGNPLNPEEFVIF